MRAIKRGRFDVRYFYDHLNRLSTRKDNFGNVTQFFYTNHNNPNEVSKLHCKNFSIIYLPSRVICKTGQ